MATITFENVRDVKPYWLLDPRPWIGLNMVPNISYLTKANTIKAILETQGGLIATFVDDDNKWGANAPHEVRVRLHTIRETATSLMRVNDFCFGTISQVCYADQHHQPVNQLNQAKTVRIELDSWYFENYPLGYCLGMLCHEFAVHPLGYHYLTNRERQTETAYKTGGQAGQQFPGAATPRVTPSTAGQADHAFAAYPDSPRYSTYQATVIDVAISMALKVVNGPGHGEVQLTNADITDLFTCYLMDLASIQSTNDHRPKGMLHPWALAVCFNDHRNRLLATFPANDPYRALVPAATNPFKVMYAFGYLISSIAYSLGPNFSKSWWGY